MAFDSLRAIEFVRSIDLTGTPLGTSTARATGTRDILEPAALDAGGVFDEAKAQAQVVGAGVFSFAQGVTPEVRQAISDSALLAQLLANKNVCAQDQPLEWFAAYFDVLQKIGWIVQESTWNDYTAKGAAVEVHAKILEVMTAALGPSAAALAVIGATIDALKGMNPQSPWMTIFSRESQKARIARFQIGLVEACLIEAHNDITQVLFFKFKNAGATFRANSGKVSINRPRLSELSPFIVDQIRAYQTNYLSTILNL
jgi:hypothetical protein